MPNNIISRKLRYFGLILKNSFFAHIFDNMNISRKNMFSWDHFEKSFFTHITENNNIRKKDFLLNKIVFWPNVKNINISKKRTLFWDYFEKIVFYHISENSNNSRKIVFKIFFVICQYLRKYQHSSKITCPYFKTYQIFE